MAVTRSASADAPESNVSAGGPRPTPPAPRSGRPALLLCRRAEVSARVDPAVVRRPALAGGERLLEAVEAAEAPAEVVDEVHERRLARGRHDRAAVRERAVMAEDDVEHGLRGLGREARQLLDLAPDSVVAERDLAVQA